MSTERTNFHLCDNQDTRCYLCQHMTLDSSDAAYCMLGTDAGSIPPDQGTRVNENFVCDAFAAK